MSGFITLGFGSHMHVLIGLPPIAGAVFVIVASTAVNLTGIRLSGLTQILVVLLAVAALVGFGLLGAPHVTAARFSPFLPHGLIGVVSAALPAFLAFAGFDMVAAAGEEVKEPERTLPRAILATLLIVLGMYLLVIVVAIGVMPWSALGSSPAPLVDAAHTVAGAAGAQLVAVAAVLTMAATTNAVLIVMSRVAFAMARDGLLPSPLAAVAARTGAPWIAILASSAMVILVALTGSVPLAASIGGFLYVSHFVLPLVTLVVLRRRGGPRPRFRTPLAPLVLGMAFTICAIFLFAGGAIGSLGGLAWLGLGMCSFALVTWRRARKRSEPATEKIDSVESAPP
jgi:APA family basic amino acid/polyamine antiporter